MARMYRRSSKGKAGKNNKGKVAEATSTITEAATPEPAAQEPTEKPLIVLTDVPASAAAKRGRPKKTQPVVDAVGECSQSCGSRVGHGLSAVCWIFFPALHSSKCKKRKGFSDRPSQWRPYTDPGVFPLFSGP